MSTDEDRADTSSDLTTEFGLAADFEDKRFVKDFEEAVALSLMDQVKALPVTPDVAAIPPLKILRLVLDKPKSLGNDKKQKQPQTCHATHTEVSSLLAPPLELMVPLAKQRAAIEMPESSFLALSEGNTKSKKGRPPPKKVVEPVVRTFNEQNNTVCVSEIREKRNGGHNRHSYFDITPELYYLR